MRRSVLAGANLRSITGTDAVQPRRRANHGYPARSVDGVQSGVEAPAMIAWLRYWIYEDQGARRYFYGDDCEVCSAPWTEKLRKNWAGDVGTQ